MKAELVKETMEKVLDPYVLVNMVSRRVRQLTAGAGSISRPLVANTDNLGVADIALREIIEDKMGFEMPEIVKPTRMAGNRRNRPQGWARPNIAANKQAA
jgi:DNA-directed RNA polymerase subunit omega